MTTAKSKPTAKPSSASPAVEGKTAAQAEANPPAVEGNAADQTEANPPAGSSPPAPQAAEADPPAVLDRKNYVVLSAVKVGGKWRTAGDKLVGLSSRLADQLAGRIEEDK